jgi:hypothetical protein
MLHFETLSCSRHLSICCNAMLVAILTDMKRRVVLCLEAEGTQLLPRLSRVHFVGKLLCDSQLWNRSLHRVNHPVAGQLQNMGLNTLIK